MQKSVALSLVLVFLLFFLPWLWSGEEQGDSAAGLPPAGDGADTGGEEGIQGEYDSARTLRILLGDEVVEMTMADYLAGRSY